MADFIAATKRIVSEVRLSPVWRFFVTHLGTSLLVFGALAVLLDALRRSPLFAPLGERLRARNARALSDGVPVTAVSGGD